MFKGDVPVDEKQAAAIEARRVRDAQRKQRILSPKGAPGVDIDFVKLQIEEKRQLQAEERDLERQEAEEANRQGRIIELLEQQRAASARQQARAAADFNAQHHRPAEDKDTTPIRTGDDDPRLGPSSLQIFAGEDIERKARVKQQQADFRRHAEAMQQARRDEAAHRNQETRLQDEHERVLSARVSQLHDSHETARQRALRETAEYNKRMAEEKRLKAAADKEDEVRQNIDEMRKTLRSPLLTEDKSAGFGGEHGNRKLKDRYRGMSQQELAAIRAEQLQQQELAREAREESRQLEAAYAAQAETVARHVNLQERQLERERRDYLLQQAQENAQMADRQQEQRLSARGERAQVSDDFFDQFGRDAR